MKKRTILMLACSILIFSMLFLQASAYTVDMVWGDANEGTDTIFNTPVAMAKDASGNVYIADMGNHRIVKMSQSGTVLGKYGTLGSGAGEFDTPFGVAIDNDGNILVTWSHISS